VGRAQRRPEGDDLAAKRGRLGFFGEVEEDPPGRAFPEAGGGVCQRPKVNDQAVSVDRAARIFGQRALEPACFAEGEAGFGRREGANVPRETESQEGGGDSGPQGSAGKRCQEKGGCLDP